MDPLLQGLSQRDAQGTKEDSAVDRTEAFGTESDQGDEAVAEELQRSKVSAQEVWRSLTPVQQKERAAEAVARKELGNTRFREKLYEAAIELYSQAIDLLDGSDDLTTLSSFFFNRSVCYFCLELYDKSAREATEALKRNPTHLKALTKRANAYEKLERLREAFEDYQEIFKVEPTAALADKLRTFPQLIAQKEQRDRDEALGKLKEVGNSLLGLFGLSLDSFNLNKNADGSMNMSFGNK